MRVLIRQSCLPLSLYTLLSNHSQLDVQLNSVQRQAGPTGCEVLLPVALRSRAVHGATDVPLCLIKLKAEAAQSWGAGSVGGTQPSLTPRGRRGAQGRWPREEPRLQPSPSAQPQLTRPLQTRWGPGPKCTALRDVGGQIYKSLLSDNKNMTDTNHALLLQKLCQKKQRLSCKTVL